LSFGKSPFFENVELIAAAHDDMKEIGVSLQVLALEKAEYGSFLTALVRVAT
jgi:hypothetical protein